MKSDVGQTDTSITQDFDHAANMIGAQTSRGSVGRTDWVTNLDLSFAYRLFEGDKGTSAPRLDVYNVLNGDAVTRVVEQGEVRATQKNVPGPFYAQPRTYQAPRYVRFGFTYEY